MTTYNNPANMAFQMATADPYHINWKTGVDQLLIVSVGTGQAPDRRDDLQVGQLTLLDHAKRIPSALMNSASAGWDMVCRMIGECRYREPIDEEFGSMMLPPGGSATASNWTGSKQFAYVRYDPCTDQEHLNKLGLSHISAESVHRMDDISMIKDLYRIGEAYAEGSFQIQHFSGFIRERASLFTIVGVGMNNGYPLRWALPPSQGRQRFLPVAEASNGSLVRSSPCFVA